MVTIWPLDELCLRLPNKKKNMFNYLILFTRYLSLVTYVTWHFVITCCLQFADQSFYSPSDRSVTFYRSLPIGLLTASNLKMAGISLLPPFALLPRKKRSPNLGSRSPESQLWLFTIHYSHNSHYISWINKYDILWKWNWFVHYSFVMRAMKMKSCFYYIGPCPQTEHLADCLSTIKFPKSVPMCQCVSTL